MVRVALGGFSVSSVAAVVQQKHLPHSRGKGETQLTSGLLRNERKNKYIYSFHFLQTCQTECFNEYVNELTTNKINAVNVYDEALS